MVGYDPQGRIHIIGVRFAEGIGHMGQLCGVLYDALKEIGIVVGLLALTDGGNALKAHAGIDVGSCQRGAAAVFVLLELREHEVPDFQEAVAVALADAAVRTTGHVLALVDVDFRTRTTGARVSHAPEVVLLAHAHNALFGQMGHFLPDGRRLVVITVDCDPQLVCRQLQLLCAELPGPGNGFLLEVVAEGEVAEHFEEGVMAGSAAHIFQVIVLSRDTQALLCRRGPRIAAVFLAGEAFLELHHAGIGKEQARIVGRNQGT